MARKVTCVVKGESNKYSDCRCITQIKVDGWQTYTREQAHDEVHAHPGSIVVEASGSTAPLIPAEREGTKYVRTRPDDTTADNLLNVQQC